MTFKENNTLTMTAILVLVFGWYFTLVLGQIARSPARDVAYTALMVGVVVLQVILAVVSHVVPWYPTWCRGIPRGAVVSHVVLAITFRSQANADDERDRLFALQSREIVGYVLAVGVCAGIWLAMVRSHTFWIAQALICALLLAKVTEGVVKLALYRRGV